MVPIVAIASLFTRLERPQILAHEARKEVLALTARRPGVQLAQIASDLRLHPKTVAYHARRLEEAGRLRIERDGRARRCYPPGVRAPAPPPHPLQGDALWALFAGATGPAALSRTLRIPRGTAGSLLGMLVRKGLVVREGRAFRPAPKEGFSGEGGLRRP